MLWNIVWIDLLITLLISLYIIRETWRVIQVTVVILIAIIASPGLRSNKNRGGKNRAGKQYPSCPCMDDQ